MAVRTLYGTLDSISLSLKVPGSPSSALQITYLVGAFDSEVSFHFKPVGKPAPPRPYNSELISSLINSSGFFFMVVESTFSQSFSFLKMKSTLFNWYEYAIVFGLYSFLHVLAKNFPYSFRIHFGIYLVVDKHSRGFVTPSQTVGFH